MKKPGSEGSDFDAVKIIANKTLNMDMVINAHYLHMLYNSVGGHEPVLDGRPNIPGGRQVIDKDGKRGIVIELSEEESALNRWRAGEFKEAEEVLAERWRNAIEKIDLESLARIGKSMKSRFHDLADILVRVNAMFENPSSQALLVLMLGDEFGFNDKLKAMAMNRVGLEIENRLLMDVAPYAAYCLKVNLLFKLGVMHRFIGTRATNRIDMQYLYYLPFCDIFASNDKFHSQLAPLLLRPYQVFSSGIELKRDLRTLADKIGQTSSKLPDPPEIEGSLTVSLWKNKDEKWS